MQKFCKYLRLNLYYRQVRKFVPMIMQILRMWKTTKPFIWLKIWYEFRWIHLKKKQTIYDFWIYIPVFITDILEPLKIAKNSIKTLWNFESIQSVVQPVLYMKHLFKKRFEMKASSLSWHEKLVNLNSLDFIKEC